MAGIGRDENRPVMGRTNENVQHLADTAEKLAKMSGRSGAGSRGPMALRPVPRKAPAAVPVALADLGMVGGSLSRASHARDQCENLCSALALQFSKERRVLGEAKEIVADLVGKRDAAASVRLL